MKEYQNWPKRIAWFRMIDCPTKWPPDNFRQFNLAVNHFVGHELCATERGCGVAIPDLGLRKYNVFKRFSKNEGFGRFRVAAKVFAFLRNPVWALQIGATIVTSVQSGLLSARASRALRQLWCDATWWYQKDYEKYRKMILEIRRNWKCKKNCLEESQTTKLNKHDVWTKVVLDISDLLDVVCFCCIWDLTKASLEKKTGNMLTSKMMLFAAQAMLKSESCTPPWAMQPEEQCVRAWSLFKKQEIETCWSQSLLFEYMSQLFSTCVHERRWDCCVRTSLMQQGVQARLGFCWVGLRRFFRVP